VYFCDLSFTLELVFFFELIFKLMKHQVFGMMLNKTKFFITLVWQDLLKKSHIMIFFLIGLYTLHYGCCPIYNKGFQAIFSVKISIHKLFHGLTWLLVLFTFLIEFYFLKVDVVYCVFQLFESQDSRGLICRILTIGYIRGLLVSWWLNLLFACVIWRLFQILWVFIITHGY
jgi:hypothetical protein